MDIRRIRAEMAVGRALFDFPLRVTFYARASTDQDEQLNSLDIDSWIWALTRGNWKKNQGKWTGGGE